VLYVIAYGVPAILLVGLSLRFRVGADQQAAWYPEGKILTAITLYPSALFLIAATVASSHEGGLLALSQEAFSKMGTEYASKFPPDQAEAFQHVIANAARIAPAMVSYIWIIVAIISLAGAQFILRQQKFNLRDSFALTKLYVPNQLIYGVAITGLLGVLAAEPYDYIGRNLSMILGLPFFFVGLAVVHSWTATKKHGWLYLTPLYLAMLFFPWLALIVAGLGVIDQWANFRQRIANKSTALK
jgi:uncharacterized protein YybS (DUF2232 family)